MKKPLHFFFFYLFHLSFAEALNFGSFQPAITLSVTGTSSVARLGFSMSSAGDIDNDGYDDIIIGAYYANQAYIIYGTKDLNSSSISLLVTNLDPATTGFTITGMVTGDNLGFSVSSAGDVNKDGFDDIIVGAPGTSSKKGAAYVIYGGPKSSMINIDLSKTTLNNLAAGFKVTGNATGDNLGYSVSSAGDINNDGYDDIIVGAPCKSSNKGAAYVIYGGAKSSLPDLDLSASSTALDPHVNGFRITGNATNDWFGVAVGGGGDVNKDQYDDIIIGASNKGGMQGAAYVIYGGDKSNMSNIDISSSTALNPSKTGFTILGAAQNGLGGSVSNAGDINNDGYDDLVIGAPYQNSWQGAAYVIYGGGTLSNLDFSTSITLNPISTGFIISTTGNAMLSYFGYAVNSAGDLNNDGYNDIIIGGYGVNSNTGVTYIIYGGANSKMQNIEFSSSSSFDPKTTAFSILGDTSSAFGMSVGSCDFNNDGFSDILIGAPGGTSGGAAYVMIYEQCPGNCTTCIFPSGCSLCSPGFVLTSPQQCDPCPANCDICSDISSCDACLAPFILYNSGCLSSCPAGFSASGQICQKSSPEDTGIEEKAANKATTAAFEATSLIGASLSSGSSLPLNFGIVAKILRNFKYLNMTVSTELEEAFYSWKVASGFMSAPKSWSSKSNSKALPQVYSRYALNPVFLINFWKPFMMSLIGLTLFAVFKSLEISTKSKFQSILKQVNVAASNFALTQFYSNLDDALFYFIIDIRSTNFDNRFRIFSCVLAVILLILGGILLSLHFTLLAKYQKRKGSLTQLERLILQCENVRLIFKDFKDVNPLTQSFLLLNIGRSIISSIIFATLFEYPMIQISFLMVLNILMHVHLWSQKPFKQFSDTCGQIFCEIILSLAIMSAFLMALFDHADSHPARVIKGLSKLLIILNFILLLGCAILLLVSLGRSFYKSYQEKKMAKALSMTPEMDNSITTVTKFTPSTNHQNDLSHNNSEHDNLKSSIQTFKVKHRLYQPNVEININTKTNQFQQNFQEDSLEQSYSDLVPQSRDSDQASRKFFFHKAREFQRHYRKKDFIVQNLKVGNNSKIGRNIQGS